MDERPDTRGLDPEGDALRSLFDGHTPPPELHARLRREAETRFGPHAHATPIHRFRRLTPWVAAAAAVLLGVVLWPRGTAQDSTAGTVASADARDIDGSGRIDVWDAYVVARRVRDAETDGLPDVDGDGRVTISDADAIARAAVEVDR